MYFDHVSTLREGWKYTYTGEQLLPFAEAKLAVLRTTFRATQQDLAAKVLARSFHDNGEVDDLKQDLTRYGKEAEACEVYVHEFYRSPHREYTLSLGDVVYFGIVQSESIVDADPVAP